MSEDKVGKLIDRLQKYDKDCGLIYGSDQEFYRLKVRGRVESTPILIQIELNDIIDSDPKPTIDEDTVGGLISKLQKYDKDCGLVYGSDQEFYRLKVRGWDGDTPTLLQIELNDIIDSDITVDEYLKLKQKKYIYQVNN
ncbi:MAG: hypothetical protein KAG37_03965 [Flavobacteriales bacterium]|nr:hypothetical protein [Flavobacteriales bacterium]